ncbi:hypothetical protein AB6A40_002061 [Gnathostoma spinigerum]|uniref:Tyrosine-protein phosphatase domain-containing protein n=1 Tax=Gnathostoma spinigerum TaxID=75299 RepID=A0ABD6EFN2_9BILA
MHEKKRVKLGVRTDDDRDYIDATYASFNREDYIIVQSPSKANVGDFWRMVWQDGVMLIVCVVEADNFSETDVTKCYPYWPVKQHSTMKILVIIMHFLDWTPSKWPNIDRLGAFVHSMSTKETTIIRRITDDYVPPVVIQGHQGINRSCAVWVGTVLMKQIERKECFDVEYLVRYLTRLRIGAFQDRINFFLTFAIAYRIASLGGWISLAEAKGRIKEIRAAALGSSVKESPNSKSKQDSGRKKRAKSLVSS